MMMEMARRTVIVAALMAVPVLTATCTEKEMQLVLSEQTAVLPAALQGVSFDALPLRIGQDGTGTYGDHLAAQLDEFILTADVLTADDIAALKAHYE